MLFVTPLACQFVSLGIFHFLAVYPYSGAALGAVASLFGGTLYILRRQLPVAAVACASGLLSLLVAMNLPYSGDTMGMMRAVLNSNFWLTMHVMTIMIGYGSVFFAGFLASYHLVARFFGQG